jgi:hypothetical protein
MTAKGLSSATVVLDGAVAVHDNLKLLGPIPTAKSSNL